MHKLTFAAVAAICAAMVTSPSWADGVDVRYDREVTTAEYIRTIRDDGLELHVWTVDDLADTLEAFQRGAQTVTTNCAKKLLDEYRESAK